MGQAAEARPVVIFKGLGNAVDSCEKCTTVDLQISREQDLFRGAL
jgi:F420-0:gamma-glutamyl ligase